MLGVQRVGRHRIPLAQQRMDEGVLVLGVLPLPGHGRTTLGGPLPCRRVRAVPRADLDGEREEARTLAHVDVEQGFAAHADNPDPRGSPVLTLAAGGRDALGKVTGRATERHRELFADVPDEEVAAARSLLRRLLTELDRQERATGKR